jgi:hypothetical protein
MGRTSGFPGERPADHEVAWGTSEQVSRCTKQHYKLHKLFAGEDARATLPKSGLEQQAGEMFQAHSRQLAISLSPSARVCSNRRTRWRECSNS